MLALSLTTDQFHCYLLPVKSWKSIYTYVNIGTYYVLLIIIIYAMGYQQGKSTELALLSMLYMHVVYVSWSQAWKARNVEICTKKFLTDHYDIIITVDIQFTGISLQIKILEYLNSVVIRIRYIYIPISTRGDVECA